MLFLLLLGAVLGALSVVFVLQNITPITVTFLQWQLDGSLAIVLLLALISGMAIMFLLLLPSLLKADYYHARLRREKEDAERELESTRKAVADAAVRSTTN